MKQLIEKWGHALRPLDGHALSVWTGLLCLGLLLGACYATQVEGIAQGGKTIKKEGVVLKAPSSQQTTEATQTPIPSAKATQQAGKQAPSSQQTTKATQTPIPSAQATQQAGKQAPSSQAFPARPKVDAPERIKVVIAPPPSNPLIGEEAMLFLTQQGRVALEAVLGKPFEVVSISPRFWRPAPQNGVIHYRHKKQFRAALMIATLLPRVQQVRAMRPSDRLHLSEDLLVILSDSP